MKEIVNQILASELNEKVDSVSEIKNLGLVNWVYDVICSGKKYIVRINPDRNKAFEFWKEKWCMETASSLKIPSPQVLKIGIINDLPFMVMNKIDGSNGSICSLNEKLSIWERLGEYAKKFHEIKQIDELMIASDEFHPNWMSKLEYNIDQLNSSDSLLQKNVFSEGEHEICRNILEELKNQKFNTGLIHGDLTPRNVILQNETIVLLDWGSSKIDIVPHTELGIIQTNNVLSSSEFESFLKGYELSSVDYAQIADEICRINLLNSLDLYRWAEGSNFLEIDEYTLKIKIAFENIN